MNIVKIKNYEDLNKIKMKKNFIIDLVDCKNKDRRRIIDFLNGLTFLKGAICKITKNQFEIKL